MGFVILGVLEEHFVHIGRRVLEEFVGAVEDDKSDLTVTQHAQLVRLLHQPELTLRERHLKNKQRYNGKLEWKKSQVILLHTGSEERGVGSIVVEILPSCENMRNIAL